MVKPSASADAGVLLLLLMSCYYGKLWIFNCKYFLKYFHHQVQNMNDKMVNLEHVLKPNGKKSHEKWTRPVVVCRFIFSRKIEYKKFSKSLMNIEHIEHSTFKITIFQCRIRSCTFHIANSIHTVSFYVNYIWYQYNTAYSPTKHFEAFSSIRSMKSRTIQMRYSLQPQPKFPNSKRIEKKKKKRKQQNTLLLPRQKNPFTSHSEDTELAIHIALSLIHSTDMRNMTGKQAIAFEYLNQKYVYSLFASSLFYCIHMWMLSIFSFLFIRVDRHFSISFNSLVSVIHFD